MLKKINDFFEYIVAFCIIINTNTVWTNNNKINNINLIILIFSLFILMLTLINKILKRKKIFFKGMLLLNFICVYNLGYVLFSANRTNIKRFIIMFIFILIPLIMYYLFKDTDDLEHNLMGKLSNIIVILAGVSLIFYFLCSVFKIISPTSYVSINWGGERYIPSYFGLYYETQPINIGGIWLIRNTGVFTEAPMHSFVLCIALIIRIFLVKKKTNISTMILIFAIFTTYSTTGILVTCLILVSTFISQQNRNKIIKFIKLIMLPLVIILFLCVAMLFYFDKKQTNSYSIRMDDYRIALKAWSEHKFIGNGFGTIEEQTYKYTNINERNTGGSSGINSIVSDGGIYLFFMYISPFVILFIYYICKKDFMKAIMVIMLIILLLTTSIAYRALMINFLAFLWAGVANRKEIY